MSSSAPPVPQIRSRERFRITARIFTGCDEAKRLEDGYRLTFPNTSAWRSDLETFRSLWSESYPLLDFELTEESALGLLALEIRGPAGTREWVESAQAMLSSSLNPAPSSSNRARLIWRFATSPIRVLPDFLIIGAMKCGTTALYSYLIEHPRIASAFRKEINFFDAPRRSSPLAYRAFFPTRLECGLARLRGQPRMTGEATAGYLYDREVPGRVQALLPGVRCIAILRNPIDRAYSFYNHNRRSGIEQMSFEEALKLEQERSEFDASASADAAALAGRHPNSYAYVAAGIYVDQILRWHACFPPEQLLVLTTEELHSNPEGVLGETLAHLGLPYAGPDRFRRLNAAPYPKMSDETRAELAQRFRPHNERLQQLLGRKLGW